MAKEEDYLGKSWRFLVGSKNTAVGAVQLVSWLSSLDQKPPEYKPPPLENTHPMEGMADLAELEQYRYQKGAFYLGEIHPDHGENFKAGVFDDRHVFLVAGTAGGKGRSILINNSIRWAGGYVALDLKGENCSITAMRRAKPAMGKGTGTSVRRFLGQEVIALDPFDQVEGPARKFKRSYNPLFDIDIYSNDAQAQIKKIASACIVPYEGTNSWISENAETILAGVIEAVLITEDDRSKHNLIHVRRLISNLRSLVEGLFQHDDLPVGGLASEAFSILDESMESNEIGYYKSCLSQNLKWLSESQMQNHLDDDSLSLKKIVQEGGSVYICIPPDRVDDLKCWLRIIIQTCINAKIELGVYQKTIPTLFNLDEFPLLGTFKEIEKNAGFIRGYNCKLALTIQNIGQIKQHYAKNWETFMGNAGAIIGFATNDLETEEYLSKRTGKIRAWETSYSVNSGASYQGVQGSVSDGKTTSQQQRERFVRMSNEIHDQCARQTMRGIVIPADGKPFLIQRINYDAIPEGGLFDSPDFIQEWEGKYRDRLK